MRLETPNRKCGKIADDSGFNTNHEALTNKSGLGERPRGENSLKAGLRVYRWLRQCVSGQPVQSKAKRISLWEEFSANRSTFVTSFGALVVAVVLHVVLPPYISEPPFAVFGCALLSLVVNAWWGTMAAMLYCVMVLAVKIRFHIEPFGLAELLWNFVMRFLFLEIIVVLFAIVRRRANSLPGDK